MQVREWITKLVDEVWDEISSEFLRPFLAAEASDSKVPAALFKHRILVSLPFVDVMREVGIDPRTLLDLLFAREVNAWLHIPRDFYEYLHIYYQIRSFVYNENAASRIIRLYLSIWNDIDLALNHGRRENLLRVYRASVSRCAAPGLSAEDDLYRLIAASIKSRLLGQEPPLIRGSHRTLAKELAHLNYVKPESRDDEVAIFATSISRNFFIASVTRAAVGSGGGTITGNAEEEPMKPRWPLGEDARDPGELGGIQGAMERFLGDVGNQDALDQLLDSFSRLGVDAGQGRSWFYKQLASKWRIDVLPKPTRAGSQVYPVEIVPWDPGSDGLDRLNIFASSGRAAHPGLTRIYRLSGVDSAYQDPAQPDLVLVIDTSGSMDDPNKVMSHAVLGGTIATQAYLERGAEVAVYNFSSRDIVLDFTPDEEQILKHLVKYQGGGTTLNVSVLDNLLRRRPRAGRDVDILIITDLGISNFDDVLSKISDYEDAHRVFVFAIGTIDDATLQRFAGTKVSIYLIQDKSDLPQIVLGAVQDSFARQEGGTDGHE